MAKTENSIVQFPRSVSFTQIETRINDIFEMAEICKWHSQKLTERLNDQITFPLNYKTPAGRRKHSVWLAGYAAGYIAAKRNDIWRNKVEFCYLVDGVLYSTHTASTRPTTEQFYARGEGSKLADSYGAHYWIGSDKPFSGDYRGD